MLFPSSSSRSSVGGACYSEVSQAIGSGVDCIGSGGSTT